MTPFFVSGGCPIQGLPLALSGWFLVASFVSGHAFSRAGKLHSVLPQAASAATPHRESLSPSGAIVSQFRNRSYLRFSLGAFSFNTSRHQPKLRVPEPVLGAACCQPSRHAL